MRREVNFSVLDVFYELYFVRELTVRAVMISPSLCVAPWINGVAVIADISIMHAERAIHAPKAQFMANANS